jgi:oligopeptide/dipeptide ABC transporter ATP-binding protein
MVRHISDRIAVMYLGVMVELADGEELFARPLHPYTQALISAVPVPDPAVEETRKRIILEGDLPSAVHVPPGCRFHTRCPIAVERCKLEVPEWREMVPHHFVACHLADRFVNPVQGGDV